MVHPASRGECAVQSVATASVSCSQEDVSMRVESELAILATFHRIFQVGQEESKCCSEAVVKGHVVYNRIVLEDGVGAKNCNPQPRLSSQILASMSALGTNLLSSVGQRSRVDLISSLTRAHGGSSIATQYCWGV